MKRAITIAVIVLFAGGAGYYLYKISPEQPGPQNQNQNSEFDLSGAKLLSEPGPVTADDHVLGNPQAKNIMVAYEDLQCPACANF